MDEQKRIALIRLGNELFKKKDYETALKIFASTNYKSGLIRLADVYYFEKQDIVTALKLYKKSGLNSRLEQIYEQIANTIHNVLEEDKQKKDEHLATHTANKIHKWENIVFPDEKGRN